MKSMSPSGVFVRPASSRFAHPLEKDQLVPDERYFFRPSEMVQRKLQSMLPDSPVPVSVLRQSRLIRR